MRLASGAVGSNHPAAPTLSVAPALPVSVAVAGSQVGTSPGTGPGQAPGRGVVSHRLKTDRKPRSATSAGAPSASVALTVTSSASTSPSTKAHPRGVGCSKVYVVVDGEPGLSAAGRRLR